MIYKTGNINQKLGIKIGIFTLVLLFSTCLYYSKLGYESFFTDEIIFVKSGQEALSRNEYSLIMEVPLVGKYLAGLSAVIDDRNVYLMRIPYAFLGLVTALIVFALLKKEYGFYWGIVGFLLFTLSPILYYSTRMVMLESPMHLMWVAFSFFFLDFIRTNKWRSAVLSGVFMGLAFGTKFTSIVLVPVSGLTILIAFFTTYKNSKLDFIKKSVTLYSITGFTFLLTYIDLILHQGFAGLYDVARSIKDRYISKETGGKIHVVDGDAYNTSPWWYYLHFIQKMYTYVQMVLYGLSPLIVFIEKNVFVFYWSMFFVTIFGFQQFLIVKSMRYFSSVEFTLIFLAVALLHFLYQTLSNKKIGIIIITVLLLSIIGGRLMYVYQLVPTRYEALQTFLKDKTANFTNADRTFIFGSIRSSRWYFDGFTPEDKVVSRKDFVVIGKELNDFKYIVVDTDEILKGQGIKLIEFLNSNPEKFDLVQFPGLNVFVRNVQ